MDILDFRSLDIILESSIEQPFFLQKSHLLKQLKRAVTIKCAVWPLQLLMQPKLQPYILQMTQNKGQSKLNKAKYG